MSVNLCPFAFVPVSLTMRDFPNPVDGLAIFIHAIHGALHHVTFGWTVGDHGIFGGARRELRSPFVELPSAHKRIGSKSYCGGC